MARKVLQALLPLLLLALGVGGATMMVKKRPKASRQKPKQASMVVDVVRLAPRDHEVIVSGQGTVVPERSIVLQPQVSGVITWEAPALQLGGQVRKGDVLARIDDRDYKLQVKLREADVARAEFEVKLERGRRSVAAREWKLLDGSVKSTPEGKRLALRQPHKARVEANLAAARTALSAANLNLSRTVLRAPFDAIVRQKRASLGQLVGPATPIATLVQADRFLVQVSVPLAHLDWIKVPGLNVKQGEGAEVTVSYEAGAGRRASRTGRVERLLGDLDPAGRMARLVVSIDKPLAIEGDAVASAGLRTADGAASAARKPRLPLLLGSYARAEIRGRRLTEVFRVPAHAVREGGKVWLADKNNKLEIRSLDILWRERDAVVTQSGLLAGDRVVVSRVPAAVPGLPLKPRDIGAADVAARKLAVKDEQLPADPAAKPDIKGGKGHEGQQHPATQP